MTTDDDALLAGITVAQHEAAHDIVTVLDAHPAMQVVRASDRLRIAVAVAKAVASHAHHVRTHEGARHMSYSATLVITDTTTLDTPDSDLTPAQAWEQRRRRLRESGTTHQADRHALTLAWAEEGPEAGDLRQVTLTFGGAA